MARRPKHDTGKQKTGRCIRKLCSYDPTSTINSSPGCVARAAVQAESRMAASPETSGALERRRIPPGNGTNRETSRWRTARWFYSCLLTDKTGDPNNKEWGEVLSEVSVISSASADTTAIALPQVMELLTRHPKHVQRLRAEIDERFDLEEVVSSCDAVRDLPCLEACIDEGLRLIPTTCRHNELEGRTLAVICGLQRRLLWSKAPYGCVSRYHLTEAKAILSPSYIART